MLLIMAMAIIARNEIQKKQAEVMSKEVDKEDAEPKGTTGLILEKDVGIEKQLRSPENSELQNMFEEDKSRLKEFSGMSSNEEEPTLLVTLSSMEKTQKNNERAAEELSRTKEMPESIPRAREAVEADSVARSASRRVLNVE